MDLKGFGGYRLIIPCFVIWDGEYTVSISLLEAY